MAFKRPNDVAVGSEKKRARTRTTGARFTEPVDMAGLTPISHSTQPHTRATEVHFTEPLDMAGSTPLHATASEVAPSTSAIVPPPSVPGWKPAPHVRGAAVKWNSEAGTSTLPTESSHSIQPVNPEDAPRINLEKDIPRRSQGQSNHLTEIAPLLPKFQGHILATFSHWQIGQMCECGTALGIFRCIECFNAPLWCRACLLAQHRYTPLHHVEKWDGKMFVRDSLADDRILHTHLGATEKCPHTPLGPPERVVFTLCDHNGFHTRLIQFCACNKSQRWEQLLAVRLFPSTVKQPQTAFTFNVMRQFQVHSLASKKSAYDYVKALSQLTNNSDPASVANRYREFLFACRLWRFLTLERRTGQAHGIDRFVPHRRPGSLALRCPACPEVGLNVTLEQILNASEHERHKWTLFISTDGNFKMQRKNKQDDPNDMGLNSGNAYCVPAMRHKAYLGSLKPTDETGTCSHLKAARMQDIAKFKNAVITGVVAVQCARHGFYLPQSLVDLIKGEGYGYTVLALSSGLGIEAQSLRWILLTYDIWCQFKARLLDRIRENFTDMLPVFERVEGAIGKMHVLNHQEMCMLQFNLNLLFHVGLTTGELIETGWAEHNLTAGSTKEMNDGHRHDVIDATCDHWNWEKMIHLASTLRRLYRVAHHERRSRRLFFDELDEAMSLRHPADASKWRQMWEGRVTTIERDGKDVSVFDTKFSSMSTPPTHAAAYAKLMALEPKSGQDKSQRLGDLGLIDDGLKLEAEKELVKRMVSLSAGEDSITAAREKLYLAIVDFHGQMAERVPALEARMKVVNPDKPEDAPLYLPSEIQDNQRSVLRLEALTVVERELRESDAHEALSELRTSIRTFNYNLSIKKTDIHGIEANTRAGKFLQTLSNNIQVAGDKYRRIRNALISLGMAENDSTFQALHRKEQYGRGGRQPQLGDSRKREPWFWHSSQPSGLNPAESQEWEKEMDRVQWFRERALLERAIEEVEILDAEFERAITWFAKTSEIWTKLALETSSIDLGITFSSGPNDYNPSVGGWQAYAHKQAAIYLELRVGCEQAKAGLAGMVKQDLEKENKKAKERADKEVKSGKDSLENDYSEYYTGLTAAL
ncbi:hypothetical protein MVEN_00044900 [Mycena venus]|uniref:CxC2-like cysteine cluster KDZ transposase-associated domain-containing protein n=1 Tax=Mycena venus TaxID=2733690 RepID=A0A8H7DG45_9AGAR|nr:hypothetical protein MVEN_00044900 [Mycena venus]